MKILVKYPTRSRPQQFLKTLRGWVELASDLSQISWLVNYDADDATMTEEVLQQAANIVGPEIYFSVATNKTKIEAINVGLDQAGPSIWDVLLLISDDYFCRRQGWDDAVSRNMAAYFPDTDGSLWFFDGSQRKINTLPCLGRTYFQRTNYIYHPSYSSFFCLHPDTRIYMANQTLKPIGEISPGEVVVGTERRMPISGRTKLGNQKLEYLCPSTVKEIHSRESEMIVITTASGRKVRCTPDHIWAHYPTGKSKYIPRLHDREKAGSTYKYSAAFVGMKMVSPVNFPEEAPLGRDRDIGWLSGILDGEGSFPRITQSLGHNAPVCAEIERIMTRLGIKFTIQVVDPSKYGFSPKLLHHYYIRGGRDEYLKVLHWLRPVKNNTAQVHKRMFAGRFGSPDVITSIEPSGYGRVCCLTTESRNFVAEGLLSHNCDDEQTAVGLRDKKLVFVEHPIASHEHPAWGGGMKSDALYQRNNKFWTPDSMNYQRRKAAGFPP